MSTHASEKAAHSTRPHITIWLASITKKRKSQLSTSLSRWMDFQGTQYLWISSVYNGFTYKILNTYLHFSYRDEISSNTFNSVKIRTLQYIHATFSPDWKYEKIGIIHKGKMVSDCQLSISFEDTYSLDMDMNIWWSIYVICSAISSADNVSIFSLLGVCNKIIHRGTGSKLHPSLILRLNIYAHPS